MAQAILASNPAIRNADLIGIGQKLVISRSGGALRRLERSTANQHHCAPNAPRPTPPANRASKTATDLPPPEVKHAAPATESGNRVQRSSSAPQSPGGRARAECGQWGWWRYANGNADDSTAEMLAECQDIETLEQQMFQSQAADRSTRRQFAGSDRHTSGHPPATPAVRRADSASGVSTEQRASEDCFTDGCCPWRQGRRWRTRLAGLPPLQTLTV